MDALTDFSFALPDGGRGVAGRVASLPVCRWDEVDPVSGMGWRDMPGRDPDVQKLNFFLFRRGLPFQYGSFVQRRGMRGGFGV